MAISSDWPLPSMYTNSTTEGYRAPVLTVTYDPPPAVGYGPEEVKKEQPRMRGLFEVFIVDPEATEPDRQIVSYGQFIAKDEGAARLKGWTKAVSGSRGLEDKDADDYDIIVRRLGDVRERRRVQEVKVVTE